MYLVTPALYLSLYLSLSAPGSEFAFADPWLITIGNNKSQRLHIMLLFLFLLSRTFVKVIVDRNETKDHLSKLTNNKQINKKTDCHKPSQTKEKAK